MTKFAKRMLLAVIAILLVFGALVFYGMKVAPRMDYESKLVLNDFLIHCQQRDYQGAYSFVGQNLKPSLTEAQLKKAWQEFESKHGRIRNWGPADISIQGFRGSVCVFPPFVDSRHAVSGSKGTGTIVYVRMVPEKGSWRLERLNFLKGAGVS